MPTQPARRFHAQREIVGAVLARELRFGEALTVLRACGIVELQHVRSPLVGRLATDSPVDRPIFRGRSTSSRSDLATATGDVPGGVRPQPATGLSDPAADVTHHRRILDRLRAHDPASARIAMAVHLRGTHGWIRAVRPPA